MEFGKIPDHELSLADLSLRNTPPPSLEVLSEGAGAARFYIGCDRLGRKDWVGKFYPAGTKEKDFLRYYASQFNTIEFNGFFYNLHSAEQVRKWVSMVPPGFRFCPKFTQSITHIHRLKNVDQEVSDFLSVIDHFGDRLGPVFLMPHPLMSARHTETILAFIESLPAKLDLFLELRHEDWYTHSYNDRIYDFLRKHKRGTVITDAAGRRDCVHMHLSTPDCFIRFVGNGLHPTDYSRIDSWVERIGEWMQNGLERCFFFVHQHDELHSPELIRYFVEQMNEKNGTDIRLPVIYETNPLF